MKKYIAFFSFIISLFANSNLEMKFSIDPYDLRTRSHIDFSAVKALEAPVCKFLLHPEISVYLDGTVDYSFSFGHRWPTPIGFLGHHAFYDKSQYHKFSFHQIGTGVDLITEYVDFRINYYHPISNSISYGPFKISATKWIDSEVFVKTNYFGFGFGPIYNIDLKQSGFQSKIVYPFESFTVGAGINSNESGSNNLFIITSFNLYKNKSNKEDEKKHPHNKRIKFYSIRTNKVSSPPQIIPEKSKDKKEEKDAENQSESPVVSPSEELIYGPPPPPNMVPYIQSPQEPMISESKNSEEEKEKKQPEELNSKEDNIPPFSDPEPEEIFTKSDENATELEADDVSEEKFTDWDSSDEEPESAPIFDLIDGIKDWWTNFFPRFR